MLVFVGTDYDGGDQFHVHLSPYASLRDLQHAIWAKQAIPPPSQHLLFGSLPLGGSVPLAMQGIADFSCIHLYTTSALRNAENAKRRAAERDAAARGTYKGADGRIRLRRRSRRASAKLPIIGGADKVPGYDDLLASLRVRTDVRWVHTRRSSSTFSQESLGAGSPYFL